MKGDLLRFPGTGAAALAALLYLYLPILIVVALSFNTGPMITIWTGFSLHWYGEALSSEPVQRALTNSIVIAFAAMIAGTLAATMAALALSGTSRTSLGRLAGAAELLIGLPLVVPEIAAAVALLMGFVLVGLPLGVLGIMAAHTVVVIPFAYLPIRARLHDMDPFLVEAAADLYATPLQAFRRVTLPLIWPGVLGGAMLAFVVSLGDFTFSFFLSSPGTTTLPVYIFGMIRTGLTPAVNAISTMLLLTSIAILVLSRRLTR
jgi:spermidine/putrescine transport system permease protein